MARFALLVVCVAMLMFCGSAVSQTSRVYDDLGEYARAAMVEAKVPGLSIVIVNDRGVVWSRNYGVIRQGSDTPVTRNTIYRVGGVSMPVTAAAVLREVEAGRLALDEPVQKILPSFKPRNRFGKAPPITIRALLAHYSGMPADLWRGMIGRSPVNQCDTMPTLSKLWLNDAPQRRYRSSKLGFTVLGCAIEVVTRRPFAEAVRSDLLAPLGMNSSSFTRHSGTHARIAAPHRGGRPVAAITARDVPARELFTTANDLARFTRMLLAQGKIDGRTVLKAKTVASMFRNQFTDAPWPFARATGFGWRLRSFAGEEVARQNGQDPGYASHIALLPKQRLGVIVLANDQAADAFAVKLANKALLLALTAKTGRAHAVDARKMSTPDAIEVAREKLERYAGHYVLFTELTPVERSDNKLKVSFQGNDFDVIPVANGKFVPRARVALGLFSVPLDGYSVRMTVVDGRQIAVLEGMPDPLLFEKADGGPIPKAWRQRVGAWRVANVDKWLRVKAVYLEIKGDVLVLRTTIASNAIGLKETTFTNALRPINGNLAVTTENGIGGGNTVEAIKRGGRETLIFSGYVLER